MPTDLTVLRVKRAARDGHGNRTPAYRWMRAKFEKLYPLLERTGFSGKRRRALSWTQVAAELLEAKKTGRGGDYLSAEATRRTWERVVADVLDEEPARAEQLLRAKAEKPSRRTQSSRPAGQLRPVLVRKKGAPEARGPLPKEAQADLSDAEVLEKIAKMRTKLKERR